MRFLSPKGLFFDLFRAGCLGSIFLRFWGSKPKTSSQKSQNPWVRIWVFSGAEGSKWVLVNAFLAISAL